MVSYSWFLDWHLLLWFLKCSSYHLFILHVHLWWNFDHLAFPLTMLSLENLFLIYSFYTIRDLIDYWFSYRLKILKKRMFIYCNTVSWKIILTVIVFRATWPFIVYCLWSLKIKLLKSFRTKSRYLHKYLRKVNRNCLTVPFVSFLVL